MGENKNLKLEKIRQIKGIITLETGLHIGSAGMDMHIGGADQQVVRDPITNEPYIPGSSLKGKIRCLLEYKSGEIKNKFPLGRECLKGSDKLAQNIVKIFGFPGKDHGEDKENISGPTRISVADGRLNDECRREFLENNIPLTEIKAENAINRITGTAENPRFIERVVAGARFNLDINLKIFSGDEEDEFVNTVIMGLALLSLDYLGGNGSRGYGRVSITLSDEKLQKELEDSIQQELKKSEPKTT